MKKLISILVVALIMVSCLAPAALAAGATVSTSSAEAATGETVTVNFTISGNTGFEACGLKVNYNSSELKLTGLTSSLGLKGNTSTGMISYFGDAITANGVLFTATFTVLKESDGNPNTKETASVSAYVDTAFTTLNTDTLEEEVMPVSVVGGTITVTEKPHTCTPSSELKGAAEATCKTEGYTGDTVCAICGEVMTYGEVIEKKAHTPGTEIVNAKEATCKEEGYTGDTLCSECGEVAVQGEAIEKKAHTPGEAWEKDDEGHWHLCTVCGDPCEKHDHTGSWKITKEATKEATGLKEFTCTTCGHYMSQIIPKINPDLDDVPKMGDVTMEIALCVMAVAALFGSAVVIKRKAVK